MSQNNESQKDLLFSKLLPALNNNPFSSSYDGEKPDIPEMVPIDDTDPLSSLRSRLFGRSATAGADNYATVNIMESLVLKYLDSAIKRFNTCSCNRCKCDVAAYALNSLTPKYVVADPKRALKIEEEIPTKDIMNAIVNAVIHVRANPRH